MNGAACTRIAASRGEAAGVGSSGGKLPSPANVRGIACLLASAFRRPALRGTLVLLTFLAGVAPLHAAVATMQQSFTGDNVKVTVTVPGDALPRFGFIPVRVTVANQQPRELPWSINLALNSLTGSSMTVLARATTNIHVPASRTVERWVFLATPDAGLTRFSAGYHSGWANLVLTLNGPGIAEREIRFGASARSVMVPWAVSNSLDMVIRARLGALKRTGPVPAPPTPPRGRATPPPPSPRPLLPNGPSLFVFDPAQTFDDWRIWSPFSRVVLGAQEFNAMPPATRAALRNWVSLGGAMYLVPEQATAPTRETVGAGIILGLAEPIRADETADGAGLLTPQAVFGPSLAVANDLSHQRGGLADKVPPAKRVGDWLVYFFIGFATLVAPLNLFAIAPVKRRHWLFVTVPVISLAAVGILIAAIYLQDGVGGDGARRALVALLPGDNQAAVFQEQVTRTGLLVGTSFPLAEDTLCANVPADDLNFQPGRPLEFDRANGRATGDWFRGRARQAQHLRRLTPTRARVELVGTAADGAPIVQSSVGALLHDFCYVDANGLAWRAERLPPGARTTLSPAANASTYGTMVEEFAAPVSGHMREVIRVSTGQVKDAAPVRGRFVARADEFELAPLVTLSSIRWKDSSVLLTGSVDAGGPGKAQP